MSSGTQFTVVSRENYDQLKSFFVTHWLSQNVLFRHLQVKPDVLVEYLDVVLARCLAQAECGCIAWKDGRIACVYLGGDLCFDPVGERLARLRAARPELGAIMALSEGLIRAFRETRLARRLGVHASAVRRTAGSTAAVPRSAVFFAHHQVADPAFQGQKIAGQMMERVGQRLAEAGYVGAVAVATHPRTVKHTEEGLRLRQETAPGEFFAGRQPFSSFTLPASGPDGAGGEWHPFAGLDGYALAFFYAPAGQLWLPVARDGGGGGRATAASAQAEDPVATMTAERQRATTGPLAVDPGQLEQLLDGGAAATALKRQVTRVILDDPVLNDLPRSLACYERYSPSEKRADSARKFFRFCQLAQRGGSEPYHEAFLKAVGTMDDAVRVRWFVHALFFETIEAQGTAEQIRKWARPARALQVLGCFAMTELAHSSHLRGLETTATYDVAAQQFEVHTPTLTAVKWWIGQAAETATHAAVFAQLRVGGGPSVGPHIFVVRIRDSDTGRPVPGVTIGDCGPKMGMDGIDNGWIRFDRVRVPHDAMLARFSQVDRASGQYRASPSPALVYVTTIRERVWAVYRAHTDAGCALAIALRFALCRRQGDSLVAATAGGGPQLLDYTSHQLLLLPCLAQLYATALAQHRLQALYDRLRGELQHVPPRVDGALLAAAHGAACGLKSYCSWWAVDAMEAARRSMGGHAYSLFSGLPRRAADFSVLTTGGGDNVVVQQQTARYTLKALSGGNGSKSARQGEGRAFEDPAVAHLAPGSPFRTGSARLLCPLGRADHLQSLDRLRDAFRLASAGAAELAQAKLASRSTTTTAAARWNEVLPWALRSAEAYAELYLLDAIGDAATAQPAGGVAEALAAMARCYALAVVQRRFGQFVDCGALRPELKRDVDAALLTACRQLRPRTAALVDGLGVADGILRSPLAPSNGDMYASYWQAIISCQSPPGVADENSPDHWHSIIRPFTMKISKL